VVIEVNCAFQKNDLFEAFRVDHEVTGNSGKVAPLRLGEFEIDHREGDIISIIFVDARKALPKEMLVAEKPIQFVKQIMIGVLIEEDGANNSIHQTLPGLVNLISKRKSAQPIYFIKCKNDSELQTLY
jgi:hypothetical protein